MGDEGTDVSETDPDQSQATLYVRRDRGAGVIDLTSTAE